MAKRNDDGEITSADGYVEPLADSPITPLSVDPVATATGSISTVPQPVSASDSPYQALLEADKSKRSGAMRRSSKVDVPASASPESDDDVVDDAIEPTAAAPVSRRATSVGYTAEPADALTAERLIDPRYRRAKAPDGGWNAFVYRVSGGRVNRGDSKKVSAEKAITAEIATRLTGGARFVPVLTRKGGVGKTTVTALLGMALAAARDDRVIAIDANPDRGTLVERVPRQTDATVRDVVAHAESIAGYTDLSDFISRDPSRLDVLASDADPNISQAFDDVGYNVIADIVAQNYSIVLTDCGTGIVHSVMQPVLDRADSVVVVTGSSIDEAKLASETLTWLETNGYGDLVANAVVAVNLATQGAHLVKLAEIESHFATRVRSIVRIPYDAQLAAGSVIEWDKLQPITKRAARDLARQVVQGIAN